MTHAASRPRSRPVAIRLGRWLAALAGEPSLRSAVDHWEREKGRVEYPPRVLIGR